MSDDQRALWLASLKPGDEVAIQNMQDDRPIFIGHVTKVDSDLICVDGGSGFSVPYLRSSGIRDSKWELGVIFPVSQSLKDSIEKRELMEKIIDLDGLSLEQLRAIWQIVEGKA